MSSFPSVVIYQIHIDGLAVLEAEHHAPVPRNAHTPLASSISLQRMQPETGRVRAPGMRRFLKPEQDAPKARHQLRREPSPIIPLMEPPQFPCG